MSWIQRLYETYDACAGREPEGAEPLMPICHTTQQVQIEVVLDQDGVFKRASIIDKGVATTMIPCTESSGGRAGSKPVNHPFADKLQYVAGDFLAFGGEVTSGFAAKPDEPHTSFLNDLRAWATSKYSHPKLKAVLSYVERGALVSDLISAGVLAINSDGRLMKSWQGSKDATPAIFKVIQQTQTPEDAFVRWRVEEIGNPVSATWEDTALIAAWVKYYQSVQIMRGYCMAVGTEMALAVQHPAKLRHGGDKAKLISSNDTTGYTFRGRFLGADEAVSVGFEVTQKAHNALRWLIPRQGSRNSEQVIVSWAVTGQPIPDPFASTLALLGIEPAETSILSNPADTAQSFALQLKRAIAGYGAKLEPSTDIVVMGIDSATPGRMGITFYRELKGSDFLERIEAWQTNNAWPQYFSENKKFIGAPAPRDIAEAAYGYRLDDKLSKATVERLLPCIIDGAQLPYDLVTKTTRRASNRMGLNHQEWEKCLGIACALFKGYHQPRSYQMTLEQDRITRDYLYGRLLAVAEHIESRALCVAGEKRDTTAARLMQRFADRPYSTWRTIELSLAPYKTRLRIQREGFLFGMEKLLDEVMVFFQSDDFTKDSPLTGEFLLGYHCQRQALRSGNAASTEEQSTEKNLAESE
ncbi:type I-C CRISPR-associated protein Cas8c/Csd1 [Serratia symbiotica]|uniref:type I-C CRISPR-associated protein Cas8c/Csd1 n=1 Tax=Serratia symbiotica TaxID=138074 RepID=UPI00132A0DBD|nr:type I-C CRISPR-associated protein Cas8c/Csd1 [Serratia symbiotica]MBF1996291.1 type I-C CRISPR-associated protein Cas8c/Csd1 [Serratia symbiotica]QTP15120.1 type I-C CRISPR-associated protein Cas8c/Csd1 [Serratia symbiotica]